MRAALFTTAMLCAAVTAAAQSHEPPAKAGAKPAPLVSRITAAPKSTTQAAAEHVEAEALGSAPVKARAKPLVSGATALVAHAAAPAATHDADAHAPAAAVAPKASMAKGPVNLATVHGRLTAALAGLHEEPARGHRTVPTPPRYTLTWPAARWRVAWRDDGDRIVVSWPE